jgi:hypothetical protein
VPRRADRPPWRGEEPATGPTDLPERLRTAARDVADTKEAHRAAQELRGALIVAAYDAGYNHDDVAGWAGMNRRTADYWVGQMLGEQT